MIDTLKANPAVAGLASEEEDSFVSAGENGRYLVLFDPLDGSSNIDVNISVGTIFSILEKPEGALATESFLQTGRQQLAAGYILYGPQTQLVFTFGHGVYMFTLNAENEFVLTKENRKYPKVPKNLPSICPTAATGCPRPTIHRRALGGRNRHARQKLQYALGSQHGCRNPPHPDARRRVHVSARQTRPRQARQTAPDVRSQPYEPDTRTGGRIGKQRISSHARHTARKPAPTRRRLHGQQRRSRLSRPPARKIDRQPFTQVHGGGNPIPPPLFQTAQAFRSNDKNAV